jgi:uncharacterized cupredoxin-like copper-binding protein
MKRSVFLIVTTFVLVALLGISAACGSDGDTTSGPTPRGHGMEPPSDAVEVTVLAEDVKFVPDEMTIPAGQVVTITLRNNDAVEHDLQVDDLSIERMDGGDMAGDHEGAGEDVLAVHTSAGESASLTFRTDQQGTFEFYCTIAGHRESGMVGELTVT